MTTDQAYWSDQLDEAKRGGQLETVRKSATAWSALFSSLLGVFGLVAFAGGLQELDELSSEYTTAIKAATSVAALALGVATYFAAKAAGQLFTTTTSDTTWQSLRDRTVNAAHSAVADLRIAKISGALAVGLVLGGTGLAIWGPAAESVPATVVVNTARGPVCGKLSNTRSGALTVAGTEIESVSSLSVVTHCPSKAK
jgi:hypothetical protein